MKQSRIDNTMRTTKSSEVVALGGVAYNIPEMPDFNSDSGPLKRNPTGDTGLPSASDSASPPAAHDSKYPIMPAKNTTPSKVFW